MCPPLAAVGDCLLPKFLICLKKQGARAELCLVPKPSADTRTTSTWEGDRLKQLPPGQIPATVSVTPGRSFLQISKQKREDPPLLASIQTIQCKTKEKINSCFAFATSQLVTQHRRLESQRQTVQLLAIDFLDKDEDLSLSAQV